MRSAINRDRAAITRWLGLGGIVVAASVALAACGSPSGGGTNGGNHSPSSQATPSPAASSGAGVTVKTASVAGFGTVLVDSKGRSLYTLTSESGGKLTCTVANGCTQTWLELDLPSGTAAATSGGGSQSSMLGTETGASGTVVTYNGWPLYTFTGDTGAVQSHGEGLKSFGGTWYLLQASGNPIKSSTASASPSASGGGYGY